MSTIIVMSVLSFQPVTIISKHTLNCLIRHLKCPETRDKSDKVLCTGEKRKEMCERKREILIN
jgi:hypothetical protein